MAIISSDYANATKYKPFARVAIVIDDMGYRKTDFLAVELKGQFTYAIVPFAPLTQALAHSINHSQREIMAHVPMEALTNNHLLGEGALKSEMNEVQTRHQLRSILQNIPYVRGINNHMGSYLTTQERHLDWVMSELAQRHLYFLDSKTTIYSMAEMIAEKNGVLAGHRHVFLDNQLDVPYLEQQFNHLVSLAKQNQYAIGIAHPHPKTIKFLRDKVRELETLGIELMPMSQLLSAVAQLKKVETIDKIHESYKVKPIAP